MDPKPAPNSAGDCEAVQDLTAAYAFGLTDPEETRLFEAALPSCPDAVAQVAEFRALQDEMRAAVPQIDPPAFLISRLAAAIAVPQTPAPTKVRRLPLRPAWLVAAAALIALALTNVYWLTRVNMLAQQQADYLANDRDGYSGTNGAFVLTSTSELRWVRLPPAQQNGKAAAFLCWNAESQTGLLYVWGFPSLNQGETYQLWLTRGDERSSAGTFQVDETGKNVVLFHSSEPIDQFTWSRITIEPTSGSPQPSSNVVVVGQL